MQTDPMKLGALLLATAGHDAQAFRTLYDTASPKLFGYALRILHKRELAEEALQEGFVAIWHNAAGYNSQLAAPMTWMATVVRNKALDIVRRANAAADGAAVPFDGDVMDTIQEAAANPADQLQWSSDAQALARCMARLEGLPRQAVGLAFFHDLSHSEVAQQLALPVGTVKTWIRRSLEKLKSCLAREGLA
ncbi:sigma-70 family RNA polymerase sigma factor [Duganella ginsengisoli]|uniref:Sigma-70 family RNA polymerase sigma factor n=2 Tax=Pseudoduganella ginsengisoli TaxID=1462440 RepID=A0A6L6PVB6_9BURK|nr:sigma-70 family RNA polymerase sigma factor [Pseudoduganella ginsengisoli]MTW01437.1 sigma-70 family RNA polymerase sigma factor [Pseudoduganella ginsengisoli]